MTVFRHHNVRSPGQVRELTDGVPARWLAWRGGRRAAPRRGRPGGRPAPGARRRPDPVRREHGAWRGRRHGPGRARRARRSAASASDGRQRRLRAGPRPRVRTGQPGARDSSRSATIRRPWPVMAPRWSAGSRTPALRPPRSTSRGSERFARTPITGWDPSMRIARRSTRPSLVPFRAAIAAGVQLVMSAHFAVPALTGDRTLPATLSRRVMRGLLRDDLGFGGRHDQRRARHARARPGRRAGGADRGGRPWPAWTCCCAPPTATPCNGSKPRWWRQSARGAFDAAELDGFARACRRRCAPGWARRARQPDLSIVGCAEHRAPVARAGRAVHHAGPGSVGRDDCHRGSRPDARILAIMPTPTDLTPADTSSTVAPGLARALRTRFASVEEIVVGVAPTDAEIAALRERAAAFDAIVVGTIDAIRQPAQIELVRAVVASGRPDRRRGAADAMGRGALSGRRRGRVHVLDPARLARSARGGARGCDPVRGAAPVVPGWRARRSRRLRRHAALRRRRHVTLRDEILEQPDVAARFLADTGRRHRGDRGVHPRTPRSTRRDRGPRDVGPCGAVCAVRARHPARPDGGAWDAVDRVALWRRPRRRRLARHRDQPVRAHRPTSWRCWPRHDRQGAADGGDHQRARIRRLRRPRIGRSTSEPARNGRSPRPRPTRPSCSRSRRCRRRWRATRTIAPRSRHCPTRSPGALAVEPEIERIARPRPSIDRALVIARGFEYATAREWALKLKELARSSPTRIRRRTSSTGRCPGRAAACRSWPWFVPARRKRT